MARAFEGEALLPPPKPENPARRQVDSPLPHDGGASGDGYNKWYHKTGGREYGKRSCYRAVTRCSLAKDVGYTRANDTQVPYVCLHFARGSCFLGAECTYLHRKPTRWDQARLDMTHDIFGRERHREDRADMGGVGSMFRPNKTLYVNFGGASSYGKEKLKDMIHKTFVQYGTIDQLKVIMAKSIAFVTYDIRASAEFAKECLSNQSLLGSTLNEILDVRWSYDDQNPVAVIKRKREAEQELATAVKRVVDSSVPSEQDAGNGGGDPSAQQAEANEEEDDIERYFDDDPYYDLPVEEENEGEDEYQQEHEASRPEPKPDNHADKAKATGGDGDKVVQGPANALGLIASYGSDSED